MTRAKFLKTGRVAHPTNPRIPQAYGREGDVVEVGEDDDQLDPEIAAFAAEHGWVELDEVEAEAEPDGPSEPEGDAKPKGGGRRKRSKRETKDDPAPPDLTS